MWKWVATALIAIAMAAAGYVWLQHRGAFTLSGACRLDDESSCEHFKTRIEQMQWLKTSEPRSDAQAAILAGDPLIVGVYAYSSSFPGIDSRAYDAPGACPVRMIEGTGDYHVAETLALQQAAERYAATYNQIVAPRLTCLKPQKAPRRGPEGFCVFRRRKIRPSARRGPCRPRP